MTTLVTDALWGLVIAGKEVGLAASGASKEERLAIDASIAVAAAASGATTVAAAQAVAVAVTAATEGANEIMDSFGVEENSPFRQAVGTTLQAAGTVASGGANTGALIGAGVQVAGAVTTAGLEEAGFEGAQMVGGAVSLIGNRATADGQTVGKFAADVGGSAVGAGAAVGIQAAADGKSSGDELFGAAQTGMSYGGLAGGAVSGYAGGDAAAGNEALLELGAKAAVAGGIYARADANGEGDLNRSFGLASQLGGVDGLRSEDPHKVAQAVEGLASSALAIAEETEHSAQIRELENAGFDAAYDRAQAKPIADVRAALSTLSTVHKHGTDFQETVDRIIELRRKELEAYIFRTENVA